MKNFAEVSNARRADLPVAMIDFDVASSGHRINST